MYEMKIEECRRRRMLLVELRKDLELNHGPNLKCECHDSALAALPQLIERLIGGDDQASESILAFYQGCIDSWAKDIYHDPVYESHFKAEIAARFVQQCVHFEAEKFCYQLKLISCEIVDAHLKHIEEFHLAVSSQQVTAG